jgi:hypothetical protein
MYPAHSVCRLIGRHKECAGYNMEFAGYLGVDRWQQLQMMALARAMAVSC